MWKYTAKELALDLIIELGSEEAALKRIKKHKFKSLIEGNSEDYKALIEVENCIKQDIEILTNPL